jgi:hypothetical protein
MATYVKHKPAGQGFYDVYSSDTGEKLNQAQFQAIGLNIDHLQEVSQQPVRPTTQPTAQQIVQPPTTQPGQTTQQPIVQPTAQPTAQPTSQPTQQPSISSGGGENYWTGKPLSEAEYGRIKARLTAEFIPSVDLTGNYADYLSRFGSQPPQSGGTGGTAVPIGQTPAQSAAQTGLPGVPTGGVAGAPTFTQPQPQPQPTPSAEPDFGAGTTTQTAQGQLPYIQFAGSPNVFERSSGRHITAQEASGVPGFFQKVQQIETPRPDITQESQFKELNDQDIAKNLMSQYNVSPEVASPAKFVTNPIQAVQDLYKEIYDSLGIASVKSQIEDYSKQVAELEAERGSKIADINDNPWMTEGAREREINKINTKFDAKKKGLVDSLSLLDGYMQDARQQAQFITTTALNAYYKQAQLDQDAIDNAMKNAEKVRDAQLSMLKDQFSTVNNLIQAYPDAGIIAGQDNLTTAAAKVTSSSLIYKAELSRTQRLAEGGTSTETAAGKPVPITPTNIKLGLVGFTDTQVNDIYQKTIAPSWFREKAEQILRQSLTPNDPRIQEEWDKLRAQAQQGIISNTNEPLDYESI